MYVCYRTVPRVCISLLLTNRYSSHGSLCPAYDACIMRTVPADPITHSSISLYLTHWIGKWFLHIPEVYNNAALLKFTEEVETASFCGDVRTSKRMEFLSVMQLLGLRRVSWPMAEGCSLVINVCFWVLSTQCSIPLTLFVLRMNRHAASSLIARRVGGENFGWH